MFKQQYWLLGRKSPLSLENKVLVYKGVIKPIWMYDIELWDCASNSSIAIPQRCQSKIHRSMAHAPSSKMFYKKETPNITTV
jgi:hypothetical protein